MPTDHDTFCNDKEKVAQLEVISGSSAILNFSGLHLPAAIGRGGVRADKHEGDGATPSGILPLRRLLYRSDRLDAPSTSLPCKPLTENDGWCDDPTHPDYNHQIHLPHPARHERLWLNDEIYNIIGVLGYNDDPVIPGRGSAIFLHIARPDMRPTDGCIALSLEDLSWLLAQGLETIIVPN
jgi:L,D-peptidoglycan transpeptidase YkuD (ErfK/YbiS/YcfS/YnhG family)